MRKESILKRWFIALAWILCSTWAHAETLVSPPPLNNSNSGIMFDVTALTNVTVTGFTAALINNTTTVGTHTFAVYTKAGTQVGFESNPAAWTLLGTSTFTLNPGQQSRTFGFPMSVSVPAGTTQGFYLDSAPSVNFRFNFRSAPAGSLSSVVTADANLELRHGVSVVNFGAPIFSRAFVGTVIYRTAATVPNAVTAISGTPQSATVSTAFAPLSVRVTGPGGPPLPGITVTFAAPGAGASAVLGAPSCVTGALGECSVAATANATAGAYNVQASVAGVVATAGFALTNIAGPPPVVVPGPAAIPTLGEWAMAGLAALLALAAASRLRGPRQARRHG